MGNQPTTPTAPSTREPPRPFQPVVPIPPLGWDRNAFEAAMATQQYRGSIRSDAEQYHSEVEREREMTRKYKEWMAIQVQRNEEEKVRRALEEVKRTEDEKRQMRTEDARGQWAQYHQRVRAIAEKKEMAAEAEEARRIDSERTVMQIEDEMGKARQYRHRQWAEAEERKAMATSELDESGFQSSRDSEKARWAQYLDSIRLEAKAADGEWSPRVQDTKRQAIRASVDKAQVSAANRYTEFMRRVSVRWPRFLQSGSIADLSRRVSDTADAARKQYEAVILQGVDVVTLTAAKMRYQGAIADADLLRALVQANDEINTLAGMIRRAELGDYSFSTKV